MTTETSSLTCVGAWGQVVVLVLGGFFWYFGIPIGMLATGVGYLFITTIGIFGIAQTESVPAGPFVFPLLIPGLVPLFYFATRYA